MIDRRQTMKLLGSAAALYSAPWPAAAVEATISKKLPPIADLQSQVDDAAKLFSKDASGLLDGVYAKIFGRRKSTQRVEQVVHIASPFHREEMGQRWVYSYETGEVGWSFDVIHDDDPRTVIGAGRPVRASDLPQALLDLYGVARQTREQDAAKVFDFATTYDVTLAGDGVSMCSVSHPHDDGCWANTFHTQLDLNNLSFQQALRNVRDGYVDDAGVHIYAYGRQLVVPSQIAQQGRGVLTELDRDAFPMMAEKPIVWEHIKNPYHWFVLTNVDGLVWWERQPFTVTVSVDHENNCIHVEGAEKRKFSYFDPRAVFGSLPSA